MHYIHLVLLYITKTNDMETIMNNPFEQLHESIEELKEVIAKQQMIFHKSNQKEFFSFEEARAFLGVTKGTLYQYVSKRKIPYSKKFNKLYFSREELVKWVLSKY